MLPDFDNGYKDGKNFEQHDGNSDPALSELDIDQDLFAKNCSLPLRRNKVVVDRLHSGNIQGNKPHWCRVKAIGTLATSRQCAPRRRTWRDSRR